MNANAKRITAALLRMAAETFSNHGSNDYTLDNNQDNYDFIRDAYIADGNDSPEIYMEGNHLWAVDYVLMEYAATLLEQEAKE